MNTKHTQLVLAILEEGSITSAAKALGLTQPTLSQTLKQIERHLGYALFDRTRTPLALTPAGELYVQAARRILRIESQLSESIQALHGCSDSQLRVGMLPGRSCELLPLILPDFLSAYPQTHIEILEASPSELTQMLITNKLDFAVMICDVMHPQLTYKLIASEELVLIANKNTSIAQRIPSGSTINLSEASAERFILPDSAAPERARLDAMLSQHGIPLGPQLTCNSLSTARRVVQTSAMVMLCPLIAQLCDNPLPQKTSFYHLAGENFRPNFFIAFPNETQLSACAESFCNTLTNRFRAMTTHRFV